MEKLEAAKELTKRGYEARVVDGIVSINRDPNESSLAKNIRDIMKEIGYEYSWGIKFNKDIRQPSGISDVLEDDTADEDSNEGAEAI